MIEREEIRFVAAADWTDDCRVTVELRKRRMTLTISEAEALIAELQVAVKEARIGAERLSPVVKLAAFDRVPAVSPDCRDGNKHRACIGTAWDDIRDELVDCECSCHQVAVA